MTAGIAVSVKSNLGVSPVSSIPYTITCVFGMEMGNATILFHVVLVLLQILLLRKNFKWINLCQVVVGIIFGKFTTLCNSLVALLPSTDNMLIRLGMINKPPRYATSRIPNRSFHFIFSHLSLSDFKPQKKPGIIHLPDFYLLVYCKKWHWQSQAASRMVCEILPNPDRNSDRDLDLIILDT